MNYGAPTLAVISVMAKDMKSIEDIPYTYSRSMQSQYHPNDIVIFEGELVADPSHLQEIVEHCAAQGITITHTAITGPPTLTTWSQFTEKYSDNQKIAKLYNTEKNVLNKYMFGLHDISDKTVVESAGLDYDKEMKAIKSEQMAADLQLPKCLSIGELEAHQKAMGLNQKTVPPRKTMSEKMEEGRGFEMDFEEL